MSDMPGIVTKTQMFELMDAVWTNDPKGHMGDYETMTFHDLLKKAPIPDATKKHVLDHWLGGDWLGPDADKILQRGLYWAMRVATKKNAGGPDEKNRRKLPICCVWICAGGYKKHDSTGTPVPRLEVSVVESKHQVTLLLLTASPPRTHAAGPDLQPVWSTRRLDPYAPETDEVELERWPASAPVTVTVRPKDSPL